MSGTSTYVFAAILTLLLWLPQSAVGAESAAQTPLRTIQVIDSGQVFIDGSEIIPSIGTEIPLVFESLQGYPPDLAQDRRYGMWYSFTNLGVLAFRTLSKNDDCLSIVLPATTSKDFPKTRYHGRLKLGKQEVVFGAKAAVSRQEFLKLIKGLTQEVKYYERDISIYFGATTWVSIRFNQDGSLDDIVISLQATKRE